MKACDRFLPEPGKEVWYIDWQEHCEEYPVRIGTFMKIVEGRFEVFNGSTMEYPEEVFFSERKAQKRAGIPSQYWIKRKHELEMQIWSLNSDIDAIGYRCWDLERRIRPYRSAALKKMQKIMKAKRNKITRLENQKKRAKEMIKQQMKEYNQQMKGA